jgi:hypothetical protein
MKYIIIYMSRLVLAFHCSIEITLNTRGWQKNKKYIRKIYLHLAKNLRGLSIKVIITHAGVKRMVDDLRIHNYHIFLRPNVIEKH